MQEPDYNPIAYGPPPGLPFPQHVSSNARPNMEDYHGESFFAPYKGREASVPSAVLSQCGKSIINIDVSLSPLISSLSLCKWTFDPALTRI